MSEEGAELLFLVLTVGALFALAIHWALEVTLRSKIRVALWDALDVGYWCILIGLSTIGVGYYVAEPRGWHRLYVIVMSVGIFLLLFAIVMVPADIWRNRHRP